MCDEGRAAPLARIDGFAAVGGGEGFGRVDKVIVVKVGDGEEGWDGVDPDGKEDGRFCDLRLHKRVRRKKRKKREGVGGRREKGQGARKGKTHGPCTPVDATVADPDRSEDTVDEEGRRDYRNRESDDDEVFHRLVEGENLHCRFLRDPSLVFRQTPDLSER